MRTNDPPGPDEPAGHDNRLETDGGTGDVVQARDVHGGVHFHQQVEPFAVTPRQLPALAHGFVNRGSELAHLASVAIGGLDAPRVVVITGTAGVGKTSLALRFAYNVRDQFPDGQLYTNLRGYDPGSPETPQHVLGRFLRDLGVPARAVPRDLDDRAALFRSLLAGSRALVVLDNAATVNQVRPLLPGGPGCLAIVTSRSRLSGLVAREGARRLELDLLSDDEAVSLLRMIISGYRGHDEHSDLLELAQLCARLPLALRIAAERAASRPHMPVTELAADLRSESSLWDALSTNGEHDADAVRTVFAWSYRSLTEPAARLFRQLGLHPTSEFGLPAAAALVGDATTKVRHDLDVLVGAHLIEQCGPDRYQFHDLLRAYAIDQVGQLEAEPVRTEARRRVLSWYLHSADAAQSCTDPHDRYLLNEAPPEDVAPFTFADHDQALHWFRVEAGNLVAAVRAASNAGEHAIAWRLAAVSRAIYMRENAFEDWITTARIGVEAAIQLGDWIGEAETLDSLGKALLQYGSLDEAEACHRRALVIRRDQGDRPGEVVSVNALGLVGLRRRRLNDAIANFELGLSIVAGISDRRWTALLRGNLAEALCSTGDFDAAATALRRDVLPVVRQLGDRNIEGNALYLLGWAHRGLGNLGDARAAIEAALQIATDQDSDMWRAHWLVELGRIQLAQGQLGDALTSTQQAAVIQRRLGDRSREAMALDATGQAYQQLDRHEEAAQFHRHAATVHRELGDRWQLALALDHLAAALDRLDERDEAQRSWREALSALVDFDDPPAAAMRDRLERQLG